MSNQLIELRTVTDELVYVMVPHIEAFMTDSTMLSSAAYTSVRLCSGAEFKVQETPLDIINKIAAL